MKNRFLLLCLSIALAIPACAPPEDKVILFIGDSFTAGDGIEKEKTFSYLVGQHTSGATSLNQGRSGWTTSAYLRRWTEVEERFPDSADLIFIQLGANDLRVDGHNEKTIETCRENMTVIVSKLRSALPNAKIILMSSVRIDEGRLSAKIRDAGFGEHSNRYLKAIGVAYQQLATEQALGYLDLIAHLPEDNTHDGAHLSEEGHKIVSEAILGYLQQIK